jgi:hypothetical protein
MENYKIENISSYREWRQDESGIYTLINNARDGVRVDFIDKYKQMPVRSFVGDKINALRLAVVDYCREINDISAEHISYISAEMTKAAILKENYRQS